MIYDRNGVLLVDNRPSFDLSVIIEDAAPLDQTIEKLSRYINASADELMTKIEQSRGFDSYKPVLLKQDISRDTVAVVEVNKFDLPGIILSVTPKRHCIYEECAAHLIGYLGEIDADELTDGEYPDCKRGDFIGKFGVEKVYDGFLMGKKGGRQVEVDVRGQVVRTLSTVNAQPGCNIYLTIDVDLQKKAEELLRNKIGAIVVMAVENGEVLAMASSPAFDQNDFVNNMSHSKWKALISNPFAPMTNRVIQGEYPPSSIYKIITAAVGLNEGVISSDSTVFCSEKYKYGNRDFKCWKKGGHGLVTVEKAMAESCDVFFYDIGRKLGVDKLAQYAKGFGLGSKTGINLEHEEAGLVPTSDWKKRYTDTLWQGGETLSVAIGQSYNLATPLQMAVLISAVANGGVRYKPLIVRKVCSVNGEVIEKNEVEFVGRLPVSKTAIEIVKKGLWKVVHDKHGTARRIYVENISISGKTGTAQVVSRKQEQDDKEVEFRLKPHAWFVAYAPSDNPKIAISVIVEHGGNGAHVAAPIAKELIAEYLKTQN
mmetsp:Transcript_21554/g.10023  ORF Transcript_21554/g.10023 Transcript_21554/m.10023 type:complete len:541 (-) Transcript_21554:4380-6002(-)